MQTLRASSASHTDRARQAPLPPLFRVSNHSPNPRVGGSRAHPIRARGGKQSSGHRAPPSYHPPSELKFGQAPVLAASHASWTTGTPPPFPFPPLLQSHPSSFHPFWDVARALLQSLPAVRRPQAVPRATKGDEGACTCTRKHYFQRVSPYETLPQPRKGLRRPCALRTRVCARPSRGSLQTQLFQSWGTAGNKAARASPSRGGRKGPAGGGGSQTKA